MLALQHNLAHGQARRGSRPADPRSDHQRTAHAEVGGSGAASRGCATASPARGLQPADSRAPTAPPRTQTHRHTAAVTKGQCGPESRALERPQRGLGQFPPGGQRDSGLCSAPTWRSPRETSDLWTESARVASRCAAAGDNHNRKGLYFMLT